MCIKRIRMSITTWWGVVNKVRVGWGFLYLIVGVFLLTPRFFSLCNFDWVRSHWGTLSWIIGWSSLGIGLGLLNSRIKPSVQTRTRMNLHYITYFIFVLFIASLAAFVAFSARAGLRSYAASALTAIVIGFSGDSLAGLIEKLKVKDP